MGQSLELVDFTQDIPSRGWNRMPQLQHVGSLIQPAQPHAAKRRSEEPAQSKGAAHFALGSKVRMRRREVAGPFAPD